MREEFPFHAGEREMQARTGSRDRLERLGRSVIRRYMPNQHRELFGKLPMILAGTLDAEGRPWASMLVGRPGFIRSPDELTLRIDAKPAFGDPMRSMLEAGRPIGLLGIELPTRRRNRMNGVITAVRAEGFDVHVEQSFGNCPQYIHARQPELVSDPESVTRPREVRLESAQLSSRAVELIRRADTFFIATASANAGQASSAEGCDVSHRGGNAGFVKVTAEPDATVLLVPDFRGNFFFNTLGNLLVNPRAGLLFIDFERGDALSLTGTAEILWDGPEVETFPGAQRMLRWRAERGAWLEGAVPFRWSAPEPAPQLAATGTHHAAA